VTAELGHWVMNPNNGAHPSGPLGHTRVSRFRDRSECRT
jgi:hypothetical protein